MYGQRWTLRGIYNRDGQRVCTVSATNGGGGGVILPVDTFTSRRPDHVFFNQRFVVSTLVHRPIVGVTIHSSKLGWFL